jgi:hypothetical protein
MEAHMSEIIYLKDILLVKAAKKNKKSSQRSCGSSLKTHKQWKPLTSSLVEKNEKKKKETTHCIAKSRDQSFEK